MGFTSFREINTTCFSSEFECNHCSVIIWCKKFLCLNGNSQKRFIFQNVYDKIRRRNRVREIGINAISSASSASIIFRP